MRKLLGDRNARWYLGGQTLSILGDTSLWLALGIWVKELTGSSGDAGLTFFFFGLSSLFSPFAGMVVDRVRRRPLLIWGNLLAGLLVLGLFAVHGRGQVYLIYVIIFLYGLAYTFLSSAQSAYLTVMLEPELLGDANGVLRTIREGLRLVSPLVGAGLFAIVGGHVIAVIDSVTFLAAAGSLLPVKVDETVQVRHAAGAKRLSAWWVEVSAGARHIWRTTVLRQMVIAVGFALLVVGFFESLIFAIVSDGLHRSPTFIGVLEVAMGAGALVGGPTAAPLMRRIGFGLVTGLGLVAMAAASVLLVPASLPVILCGMVLFGISLPWIVVGSATALQLRTPAELQGRVSSAADTVLSVPQTFSIALGASLVGIVDYKLLLAIVAIGILSSGIYLLSRREQRTGTSVAKAEEPALSARAAR